MLVNKYLIREEIDCSGKDGDVKTNCNIQKLKKKISDLKRKRASATEQERKEDIDYQIDALLDLIDAEEEKRDAQQDMDKMDNN